MSVIPLESNPEVMNKFLQKLGVPSKIQVVDIYGVDPEMLAFIPQPVLALILLFPDNERLLEHLKNQADEIKMKGQFISDKLYFIKQYIHNACGTMALIHSIANLEGIELRDGHLKQFLDDSKSLTPHERGELLKKNEGIINIYKEVASEGQTTPPDDNEEVLHHYVAFVHKDGHLYELDGSRDFPINHGPSSEESFLRDAARACREYMNIDPGNVAFTVVALIAE